MTMRMMIWGIPANSCHEGLDKMWSLALCSAKERETTFLTRLKGQLQMNLGQFKSFTLCSGIYAEFLIISESKKKKKKSAFLKTCHDTSIDIYGMRTQSVSRPAKCKWSLSHHNIKKRWGKGGGDSSLLTLNKKEKRKPSQYSNLISTRKK